MAKPRGACAGLGGKQGSPAGARRRAWLVARETCIDERLSHRQGRLFWPVCLSRRGGEEKGRVRLHRSKPGSSERKNISWPVSHWASRSRARMSSSGSPGVGRGGSTPAILSRFPSSRINSSGSLTEATLPRAPPSFGQSPSAACTPPGRTSATTPAEKKMARRRPAQARKRIGRPSGPSPSAHPALCRCLKPALTCDLNLSMIPHPQRFRIRRTFKGFLAGT